MEHADPVRQPGTAQAAANSERRATTAESGASTVQGAVDARRLIVLQRIAGNGAVNALLSRPHTVQRDPPPNASMPLPNASKAADAEVIYFEGQALRFDAEVLYGILSRMAERKGIDAPAEFTGRFENAPFTILRGTERPGLRDDIRKGLRDTTLRLNHERETFCTKFEGTATEAAKGILDDSKKKIEDELKRLGITGSTTPLETGGSVSSYQLSNTEAAASMKRAAGELVPPAKEVERTSRESAEASRKLGESQTADPFNLTNRGLVAEDESRRTAWMAAQEAYEKVRRVKVAANPSIALYTEEPGAAGKLAAIAAMPDKDLANDVGEKAHRRLENIEQVRGELGKGFAIWQQSHLRRVTLDQMQATPLQREFVDRRARQEQGKGDGKMLFVVLAIGLGLLSALPTGGAGLMAGISIAAGLAGAGLALYQVGQELSAYSLATAANATDFDKAKAISDKDPDGMQLALDCVMALGDVFAAAAAFKAIRVFAKAAKGGDVGAAIKLVRVTDTVGVTGAPRSRIIAEAVSGLSGEAIEGMGKTVAKSGGMSQQQYLMKMMAGVPEHTQFKGELSAAMEMMQHVQGRIPDTARDLVKSGKVRVFSEASLIDVYGAEKGAQRWKQYSYAEGFIDSKIDTVFIRSGNSPEDLAGTLIHEATHRVGDANPLRLNDFMSEAIAEFAERDFYMTLYADGGPLQGTKPSSTRIQQFLSWSDDQLMHNIEVRYFSAKEGMAPAKRALFKNSTGASADEVVKQLFVDVTADYRLRFPSAGR